MEQFIVEFITGAVAMFVVLCLMAWAFGRGQESAREDK